MNRKEITEYLIQEKIVAIIRSKKQDEVAATLQSLIHGGVKALEITSNTPGYAAEINKAQKLYSDVLIGAGTVTNMNIAEEAIKAGAQFLVTPNTNIDIIKFAHKFDIPVIMGAITPTEVCMAVDGGADIIKLFPAGNLGIDYFKAIRAPLDTIKFFVVGGINLSNIQDWLKAGACGVGIGNNLTKSIEGPSGVKHTAEKFIALIKELE